MTAVITLLSSIFIAVFLIGPAITAKLLIEFLIIKQPSRTQSSTEELARSVLGSMPPLMLAIVLVWLRYHGTHAFDPDVLLRVFNDGTRASALPELWPVRTVLSITYAEILLYVLLVWFAVRRIPHLEITQDRWSQYGFFNKLTSPYLKSEWDVLASRLLLPPQTEVYADVATKSQKIYMGLLAGAKTASDGSLIHLQLKEPTIRGQERTAPGGAITKDLPYIFRNSVYFVIPAAEIANVNLRFLKPAAKPPALQAQPSAQQATPSSAQPILEISLEDTLQQLDEETRRSLRADLEPFDAAGAQAPED